MQRGKRVPKEREVKRRRDVCEWEKDHLQVTGVGVGAVRGESGDCLIRLVRGMRASRFARNYMEKLFFVQIL